MLRNNKFSSDRGDILCLSLSDSSEVLAAGADHSHGFSLEQMHLCVTRQGDHMSGRPLLKPTDLRVKCWEDVAATLHAFEALSLFSFYDEVSFSF